MLPIFKSKCRLQQQPQHVIAIIRRISTNRNLNKSMIPCRPQTTRSTQLMQRREISLYNLISSLPLKRKLTILALGGTSLAVVVILGPFLLIGLGGIASIVGFRLWRFKKLLQQQRQESLNKWPDFLNSFMREQHQVFGKDQLKLQTETLKRFEIWTRSTEGRNTLIELGMHPERVMQDVHMRGSSSSIVTTANNQVELKIELEIRHSDGFILSSVGQLDKESGIIELSSILLKKLSQYSRKIPVQQKHYGGGRIIEGEFHDV